VDPVVPGFAPDSAGGVDGGRLTVDADVDGQRATIHVLANDVGSAFGVSFHVVARGDDVVVADAETAPLLGDDARTIARIVDHDVALGGTRTSVAVGEAVLRRAGTATSSSVWSIPSV
jgi:hypothetical protein